LVASPVSVSFPEPPRIRSAVMSSASPVPTSPSSAPMPDVTVRFAVRSE
jgi:hypothetical protein